MVICVEKTSLYGEFKWIKQLKDKYNGENKEKTSPFIEGNLRLILYKLKHFMLVLS